MWQTLGQNALVEVLRLSLESGRLSHAYLLVGPRHVGKMTLAADLARALNCESQQRPCGECSQCHRITHGKHADVQVVGLHPEKKEIGIDQVKEIQRAAFLRPFEGKNRVFIIDGAETMSAEAANCLLKTLEEPPPNVFILLLSEDETYLLPTIISRCQKLELRPMPVAKVGEALVSQWNVPKEKAELLASLSCGCLGWAMNALKDEGLLGAHAKIMERFISFLDADLVERFDYAAELANLFSKDRQVFRERLRLWQGLWRDMLLAKEGCPEHITNVDRVDELERIAEEYSRGELVGFIGGLGIAARELALNANPRLVLEVLMLNMPSRGKTFKPLVVK